MPGKSLVWRRAGSVSRGNIGCERSIVRVGWCQWSDATDTNQARALLDWLCVVCGVAADRLAADVDLFSSPAAAPHRGVVDEGLLGLLEAALLVAHLSEHDGPGVG